MKTCGIICEYNPFHNGHQYQIEQAGKKTNADVMIAIMSSHFMQRGEPAFIDKWKRAEAAVKNGIDVVIELPYICATQAAHQFAQGGVDLLKLADVDYISFGSECGNIENLSEIADILGLSETYLSRLFKKETGERLQDYIVSVRLEHAANLLKYSEESISKIAEYVNFPSQSYMGKIFKERYLLSPKQYREKNRPAEYFRKKV